MIDPFDFIVLAFVVYRITRFFTLDSLIEDTRDRLVLWLEQRRTATKRDRVALVFRKLYDLATCAFCISVWVAAGALAAWCWATGDWYGNTWPFIWLGLAAAGMAVFRFIDPPE